MGRYVDLHSHLLPGLDDGAPSLDVTLAMVHSLAALGFSELHATPHQRADLFAPPAEAIAAAFDTTSRAVADALPGIHLAVAAENYWDEVLAERLQRGAVPSYEGGKAFLFELSPAAVPPRLEAVLFQVRLSGCVPVIAHPERYAAIQRSPELASRLAQQAGLLVDLAALSGQRGRAETRTARRLLEEGTAHAVASDMHAPADEKAIAEGMTWIARHLGAGVLDRLLAENPRRMLGGELP